MIEPIRFNVTVSRSIPDAFELFAKRLGEWWPHEYTWSQDVLEEIGLEPHVGGLCFEEGPNGFGCDWGRVLEWESPRRLVLAWQISPRREPVPNPAHASTIEVRFDEQPRDTTIVTLEHRDFDRHGDGAAMYRDALASPEGWPRIMQCYARAAGSS